MLIECECFGFVDSVDLRKPKLFFTIRYEMI
jgi:hypothetical protein